MLQPPARQPQQQTIDGRLVLGQIHGQVQGRERVGDGPVGALRPAGLIDDRRRDRRETIDQLEQQHAAAVGELLPPELNDRESQQVRLVLLAGADVGIATGMRRGRPDAAPQPFRRLVAGVAPALVVVGNRPAAIQVPPDWRVRIRQGLGADFRHEGRTEAREITPVALRPSVAAVQILVTGPGEGRT